MYAVAGQGGMGLASPVIERDRARRAGQSLLHRIGREEHALTRGVQQQARVQQSLPQRRPAHLNANLGQDAFGIGEDGVDLLGREDLKLRAHA
jgi:hypothetical protein